MRAREQKEGPPLLADPVTYKNFFAMGTCMFFFFFIFFFFFDFFFLFFFFFFSIF